MVTVKEKEKKLLPEDVMEQALLPNTEIPNHVPENWCWAYLGSFSEIIMGQSPEGTDTTNDPSFIPLIGGAADIGDRYPKVTRYTKVPTKTCKINDIILCIRATLGRPIISDGEYCLGRGVAAIRPKTINIEFVRFGLQCFEKYLYENATGTTFGQVSSTILKKLPFPLAPLKEQQRIVDRIESLFAKLDEAKEKAQAVVDGFEDRKAAILHKAFTGELTEKWRYNNGVTLESWNTENLEESFDVSGGIQKQPSRMPDKNPVPYITVANVYRNRIDLTDLRYFEVFPGELEKLQLKYGDILIVEGNGSGSEIGRCAMWRNELPVCIHQNHIIRVRRKNESVLPEYVLYYLNSSTGRQIMKSRAKTTAGLYNLSTGKIKTIPVPYASLGEQKEIVRMLDYLLEKELQVKDKAETTIEEIDNMKKSILSRAFRGELGTNDPNDESAEDLIKKLQMETIISKKETKTRATPNRKEQVNQLKKSVLEIISQQKKISPEELKTNTGLDIDEFYLELKALIDGGKVKETRDGLTVFLEENNENR